MPHSLASRTTLYLSSGDLVFVRTHVTHKLQPIFDADWQGTAENDVKRHQVSNSSCCLGALCQPPFRRKPKSSGKQTPELLTARKQLDVSFERSTSPSKAHEEQKFNRHRNMTRCLPKEPEAFGFSHKPATWPRLNQTVVTSAIWFQLWFRIS